MLYASHEFSTTALSLGSLSTPPSTHGYAWSDPVSVEFAQLKELSILNSKTGKQHVITFRVGFLALMVLIGIAIAFLGIPALLLGI